MNCNVSVIKTENTTDLYMLPAYIRTTSMIACIVVMVLGIIGNLMVSSAVQFYISFVSYFPIMYKN